MPIQFPDSCINDKCDWLAYTVTSWVKIQTHCTGQRVTTHVTTCDKTPDKWQSGLTWQQWFDYNHEGRA